MDEWFELKGVSFVWDANKSQAVEAFFDPFLRIVDAGIEEQARDAVVGMDEHWNLLYVVHLVLEGAAIRVISARKATPNERSDYEY